MIVVDQTQNKDLANNIKKLCEVQSFNVEYIWQSVPSLTKARNTGLKIVRNDVVIFMDDDVDVRKDTFFNVDKLFRNPKVAMVAGFDGYPPNRNSFLGYIFNKANYRKRYIGHVASGIYGRLPIVHSDNVMSEVRTEWGMGFFFVVRKSLVDKWNLAFDEKLKYYAYAEDLDFTHLYYLAANHEGLDCYYSLNCSVIHNVSKEYRTPKRALCFMMIIHREYIRYKHFGGNKFFYSFLWSCVGDIMFRIIHREPVKDIVNAIIFMFKNKESIRKGDFLYEQFMHS